MALGRWVSTQRECKKVLDRADTYPKITAARTAKLEALGFAWELSATAVSKRNSKGAHRDADGWEVQLTKLMKYKCKHGDCNVPQQWAIARQLGQPSAEAKEGAGPRRAQQ